MPARLPANEDVDEEIIAIFQQAQANGASHRKNVVQLHKLFVHAAQQSPSSARVFNEKAFNTLFEGMVHKVLPLKKGTTVADRIVKFVGLFVKFTVEKANEELERNERGEEEDTAASRFVEFLLRALLKGFNAKDKIVRYRAIQFVAEIVTSLGELDEDLYTTLRQSLLERIQDKEASVRVQAVIAIGKLQKGENPDEFDGDDIALVDVLCDILQYDPVADVRRAALLATPATERTLSSIITRIRDPDISLRQRVFQHSLPQIPHPRVLTIVQRERILRTGIGDREFTVKDAAQALALKWLDALDGDLVKFLETFDLVGGDVAELALTAVFEARPALLDSISFEGNYWDTLTPEKAFLARAVTDFCVKQKNEARIEALLPVVTALAFRIQTSFNALIDHVKLSHTHGEDYDPFEVNPERDANWEAEQLDLEFIVDQLFRIAVNMDYGDEVGRRKMFVLVRDMISQRGLPEGLVPGCLDVLRKLTGTERGSERDFIRLVVEVVQVMRDPGVDMDEEVAPVDKDTEPGDTPMRRANLFQAPEEKSAEEQARMMDIDMRCLSLCIAMLERVMSTFDENSTLDGILAELIIPAVKSKEPALRERGMIALGLCCLIHRKLVAGSFSLFLNQVEKASPSLKVKALQIVFDMLTMYERDLMAPRPEVEDSQGQIVDFLLSVLGNADTEAIQATAALGLSKLLIAGVLTQDRVVQSLVMVYFSPETIGNQQLRQCLSIALPIYACSSSVHQQRLQRVVIPSLKILNEVYNELEGEQDMIPPLQILGTLVDWTDAQKAYQPDSGPHTNVVEDIHIDLAVDMIIEMYDADDAQRKLYIQMLNKLHLPDEVDENKLRKLKYLIGNYRINRAFPDATSKNAFDRFAKSLEKQYSDVFNGMSEEDSRQMEALKDLFEFLDEVVPEEAVNENGRKRATRAKVDTNKKTKRKRGDSDKDSDSNGASKLSDSPPAKRARSTRAAAIKGRSRTVTTEGGSEGSSEEEPPKKGPGKRKRETIEDIDADIDQLLGKKVKRLSGASTSTDHSGRSSAASRSKNGNTRSGIGRTKGKSATRAPVSSRSASSRHSLPPDSNSEDEGTVQESVPPEGSEVAEESDDASEGEVAGDLLGEESE